MNNATIFWVSLFIRIKWLDKTMRIHSFIGKRLLMYLIPRKIQSSNIRLVHLFGEYAKGTTPYFYWQTTVALYLKHQGCLLLLL